MLPRSVAMLVHARSARSAIASGVGVTIVTFLFARSGASNLAPETRRETHTLRVALWLPVPLRSVLRLPPVELRNKPHRRRASNTGTSSRSRRTAIAPQSPPGRSPPISAGHTPPPSLSPQPDPPASPVNDPGPEATANASNRDRSSESSFSSHSTMAKHTRRVVFSRSRSKQRQAPCRRAAPRRFPQGEEVSMASSSTRTIIGQLPGHSSHKNPVKTPFNRA